MTDRSPASIHSSEVAMSPTTCRFLSLQCVALVAVALTYCSVAQAQIVEAFYNPVDSEFTINVIADNIATLSIVGQTNGIDPELGFVNFSAASSITPLGAPVEANSGFVLYDLGLDGLGNQINFTPGSYNIGPVFDPGITFTLEPIFQDSSVAVAANGDNLGRAAISINGSSLAPISTVAVPEPGALPLLLMGISALVSKRRRSR